MGPVSGGITKPEPPYTPTNEPLKNPARRRKGSCTHWSGYQCRIENSESDAWLSLILCVSSVFTQPTHPRNYTQPPIYHSLPKPPRPSILKGSLILGRVLTYFPLILPLPSLRSKHPLPTQQHVFGLILLLPDSHQLLALVVYLCVLSHIGRDLLAHLPSSSVPDPQARGRDRTRA